MALPGRVMMPSEGTCPWCRVPVRYYLVPWCDSCLALFHRAEKRGASGKQALERKKKRQAKEARDVL